MSDPTNKFCSFCGSRIKAADAKFCSKCGTPVKRNSVASTPSESTEQTPNEQSMDQPIPYTQGGISETSLPQARASTFSNPYSYAEQEQSRRSIVTPNDIPVVSGAFFTRNELISIGIFSAMAYLSHLMRYFLLFNTFPALTELIIPIIMYPIVIVLIFVSQKYLMRSNGIQPNIEANRFDYTLSLVFSSFLFSLIPVRYTINKEQSTVPQIMNVPTSGQYGINYQEMPREKYIGTTVRPRMYMLSTFFVLILSFISIWMYFNVSDPSMFRTWKLMTVFLAGYVVVELVPIFGRHNKESSDYGRYRTLGIFFLGLVIWVSALLGEGFFTALLDRAPV